MEQREWSIPNLPIRWYSCAVIPNLEPQLSGEDIEDAVYNNSCWCKMLCRERASVGALRQEVEDAGAKDDDGDDMMAVKLELERYNAVDISRGRGKQTSGRRAGPFADPTNTTLAGPLGFSRIGWEAVGVVG